MNQLINSLKVLSYWNLNWLLRDNKRFNEELKVLSYWNLNKRSFCFCCFSFRLKVLSYWNLNKDTLIIINNNKNLKYYHIGI